MQESFIIYYGPARQKIGGSLKLGYYTTLFDNEL